MPSTILDVPTNIRPFIGRLIEREGGYSDRQNDLGGPTKFGITIKTLRLWRNDMWLDADDMKKLSEDEAAQIYYNMFWVPLNLQYLHNDWIREFVFDWSVT